jgi:hypothetical protein
MRRSSPSAADADAGTHRYELALHHRTVNELGVDLQEIGRRRRSGVLKATSPMPSGEAIF